MDDGLALLVMFLCCLGNVPGTLNGNKWSLFFFGLSSGLLFIMVLKMLS